MGLEEGTKRWPSNPQENILLVQVVNRLKILCSVERDEMQQNYLHCSSYRVATVFMEMPVFNMLQAHGICSKVGLSFIMDSLLKT